MIAGVLRKFAVEWNLLPCPACGTGEGGGANLFCPECLAKLHFVAGERCRGCGGALDGVLGVCSKCVREEPRPWLLALTIFDYRDEGRDLVRRLKFSDQPELARPLAKLAIPLLQECGERADGMVPVPLHYMRQWKRSYNQSELVAGVVAGELGVPLLKVLKRVRATPHQAELKRSERLKNLRGAFAVGDESLVRGKNLWLVDDVLTTGITLTEAARTLHRAGAKQLYVLTLARA